MDVRTPKSFLEQNFCGHVGSALQHLDFRTISRSIIVMEPIYIIAMMSHKGKPLSCGAGAEADDAQPAIHTLRAAGSAAGCGFGCGPRHPCSYVGCRGTPAAM